MKPLILSVAITIIFTMFIVYQQDHDMLIYHQEELKNIADDCANSASLFYDIDNYSNGLKVFNSKEGKKVIEYMLISNLSLTQNLNPTQDSYWREQIDYNVDFYDDENTVFPYLYKSQWTGYERLLKEPTVIVEIDGGKGRYRLGFINPRTVVRSSAYEYVKK